MKFLTWVVFYIYSFWLITDLQHNGWEKLRSIICIENLEIVLRLWSLLMENQWMKWWVSRDHKKKKKQKEEFEKKYIILTLYFLPILGLLKLFICAFGLFYFLGRKSEICRYIFKKSSFVAIICWFLFRKWTGRYDGWGCYFKPFDTLEAKLAYPCWSNQPISSINYHFLYSTIDQITRRGACNPDT